MIKLNREDEPKILLDNKVLWSKNLNNAVCLYGDYRSIPESEKNKLVSHYNKKDIKNTLIKSSNGKCAFCECIPSEGGNIEIEHFKPKSLYPEDTFNWNNLLPSCRKCNGSKLAHDTLSEPIVNPYDISPEEVFTYELINIKAKKGKYENTGKNTIRVCSLNSQRLWKPRSEILVSIHQFFDDIEKCLDDIKEADSLKKRINRIRNLNEAIERIESLSNVTEKYSSFCKYYIEESDIYKEAKSLIKKEQEL